MKTFRVKNITLLNAPPIWRYATALWIIFCFFSLIPPLTAQNTCSNTLVSLGISLDQKDMKWLSDNQIYCRDLTELIRLDSSDMTIASAQILIRLESNNLMHLSSEEIDIHEELLTEIIHGAFTAHQLTDQTALSAVSWYQIFVTQMKE